MPSAIVTRDLRKNYRVASRAPGLKAAARALFNRTYKDVHAVAGVSFSIEPGERVGFLGPNGAGKTTTLKMLAGLLHPTSGEARVLDYEPRRRATDFLKQITLVMGNKQQLLWDLPPAETFALNRAIYEIEPRLFNETLAEISQLLELGDLVNKPARQLSLGERMKCELCAALLHRPKVLFLDEPTIGLDVSLQATVRSFIRAYNERFGATVILTSHYMDDVAALCPRVIVIDRGALIYDGALTELVQRVRPDKRITVRLSRPVEKITLSSLGELVEHEPTRAVLQVKSNALQASVAALMALPLVDLSVEDPPLEDVMRDLFAAQRKGLA